MTDQKGTHSSLEIQKYFTFRMGYYNYFQKEKKNMTILKGIQYITNWVLGNLLRFLNWINYTASEGRLTVNDELEGTWKEAALAQFKVLFQRFSGEADKNHKNNLWDVDKIRHYTLTKAHL
jgi:hypothetical protein